MKKLLVIFLLLLSNYIFSQEYIIKDKTKYYVASSNFGAAPQYNLILDKEGYKIVAKSLGVSIEDAKKIIEECSAKYQPNSKRDSDYGYIMYKICEVKISLDCHYFYGETMYLMFFPNEINTHMPPDKLAANGKGFFQLEFPDKVSTIPYKNETYKPQSNSNNGNYSFGFIFNSKGQDSIVIEKVINTSHAKTAGLQVGDIIVSVNNIDIRNYNKTKASEVFKNCGFTKNNFKVIRNGNEVNLSIDKVNSNVLQTVCITGNCSNGDCTFESINGYTIQGKCANGVLQGKVKFSTKEGFVFYEGEVYKYPDGDNINDYRFRGLGVEYYEKGDKYEGNFKNGKREGVGTYTFANGEVWKGFWKEGKYYDEIARGFDNEKVKTFVSDRWHLYEQEREFLSNKNQTTFTEKSISEFKAKNGLTDAEFDKLMQLCDFKYKSNNLNTPAKLKKLINDNQENYPYSIYAMGYLSATNNFDYMVIRMPLDENYWLKDDMRPSEENSLSQFYFLAPYSEVKGYDYLKHLDYKKQLEVAENWKKTEEKNAAALSAYWNEKANNEYKGIAIYQFKFWDYNKRKEDYSYAFVSVFGPPGQSFSNSDYFAMDKLAGASGDKIAMEFFEGKDESFAEDFAMDKTGTHRYSITKRFNYYMPQKSDISTPNTKNQLSSEQIKKIDQAMEEAYENLNKLTDELDDDNTSEKMELRKKINNAIFYTDGDIISEPAKVTVVSISPTDKYYNENKKFIGKTGAVEGTMLQNSDGTYYGTIKFEGEKSSTIFYQVELKK